jgi:purine-nucleoside phosphorylase
VLNPQEFAAEAAAFILDRFRVSAVDLAFVLGSGWSAAADDLGDGIGECGLPELPGFARPSVAGHGGALRLTRTAGGKVAAVFTGRTHLYEGLGVAKVVHGVRTAAAAGARIVVLTNGCGGLNRDWAPGTPVLIRDHRLRDLARSTQPGLPEGVYVQFHGPQFETPAEVRMAGILGGDLVGMSTALEAIAAREAGMEVLGISLVTNLAAGISPTPLNHEEVLEAGREAAPRLRRLLTGIAAAL